MSHFKVERCIFQTIPTCILSMLVTHSTSDIPLYLCCFFLETHCISIFNQIMIAVWLSGCKWCLSQFVIKDCIYAPVTVGYIVVCLKIYSERDSSINQRFFDTVISIVLDLAFIAFCDESVHIFLAIPVTWQFPRSKCMMHMSACFSLNEPRLHL